MAERPKAVEKVLLRDLFVLNQATPQRFVYGMQFWGEEERVLSIVNTNILAFN